MLNSSIAVNKSSGLPPLSSLFQLNDDERLKIEKVGFKPSDIGLIQSESEIDYEDEDDHLKLEQQPNISSENYELNELLPMDLAELLLSKEIPLQYVRGLLLVRDQKEIKSVRRLKVERYL
jgi:hypothetical protein